ncbi:MAG: MerR family transcriptional regulator [Chloroflexi bacterium]|nr:MerR family transcriptional regulator [Chloroflexota bacterium]
MSKKDESCRMQTGTAARSAGVSLRTLQYYDRIGLLPAGGRQANGMRYYTGEQLLRLEQILFYKNMGFSLAEIRDILEKKESLEIDALLNSQERSVYAKIENLYSIIGALDAARQLFKAGIQPPWGHISALITSLSGTETRHWDGYALSPDDAARFTAVLHTHENAFALFHDLKKLIIKASVFQAAGVSPSAPIAERLRQEWQEYGIWMEQNHPELLASFKKLDENQQIFEAELYASALAFLNFSSANSD